MMAPGIMKKIKIKDLATIISEKIKRITLFIIKACLLEAILCLASVDIHTIRSVF